MQSSIVQVLESDNGQVQKLVRLAVEEVGAAAGPKGVVSPLDNCQLMETMHENHAQLLMPKVERYRAIFEHFYRRCIEDKVCPAMSTVARHKSCRLCSALGARWA